MDRFCDIHLPPKLLEDTTALMSDRRSENRLLGALPEHDYHQIAKHLSTVVVTARQVLMASDEPLRDIYFVNHGVISLVSTLEDGAAIEVASIGREGMIGSWVLLGSSTMSTQAVVQIGGEVLRMSVAAFKDLAQPGSPLHGLANRYTLALQTMIAQKAACNCIHPVEKRLSCWLLLAHDRMDPDQFALSQDVIAQMLGVRRPTVTVAAGRLQKAKVIRYSRGKVTVLNRKGLERFSCECYGVVRREFQKLR